MQLSKNTVIEEEEEERQGRVRQVSDDTNGKGRGKQWETKTEEEACNGRLHCYM